MAKQREGLRSVKLMALSEENIFEVPDERPTRTGKDPTSRQCLRAALQRRDKASGKPIACFMLAEPPSKTFSESDPLDSLMRDPTTGDWLLGNKNPAWMAERQRRIEARKARRDERMGRIAQSQGADVVKAIAAVSSTLGQAAEKAMEAKKDKAPPKEKAS